MQFLQILYAVEVTTKPFQMTDDVIQERLSYLC